MTEIVKKPEIWGLEGGYPENPVWGSFRTLVRMGGVVGRGGSPHEGFAEGLTVDFVIISRVGGPMVYE